MILSDRQIETYRETLKRTKQWVVTNFPRLEAEADLQAHYKAPAFWAALGDMPMAGRHFRLIQERFLRKDGDFRMAENQKGFVKFQCTLKNQYIYPNGWLIAGLRKLGANDVARKGLEFS